MNIEILKRQAAPDLAYIYNKGSKDKSHVPVIVFMGGYRSDMMGTKAAFFESQAIERGQGYVRFDYTGHGHSDGRFADGTISIWKQDALDIIGNVTEGKPLILVGSSMGGWIALLCANELGAQVKGVITIAGAPDFTEEMYDDRLSNAQKAELMEKGIVYIENDYSDEPYEFTRAFYEDGKNNRILTTPQKLNAPMRIIQGMQDADVPWKTAIKIQKNYHADESDVILIEDGDHRLSRPQDLDLIDKQIRNISGNV